MSGSEEESSVEGECEAIAVVQARMSSTRLPGKTLREMAGVPMLQRLLDRIGGRNSPTSVVVATSVEASDDPLAEFCAGTGIPCVRGSEENVLGRFVQVIDQFEPRMVVRLTGDNPLVNARAVSSGLSAYLERAGQGQMIGVSNHLEDRTDPYGYCVEVIRPSALRELDGADPTPEEREHVTLALRRRPRYRYESYSILPGDQRALRWTVDTEEDFRYIKRLFEELGPDCTAEQAVQWSHLNSHPLVDYR